MWLGKKIENGEDPLLNGKMDGIIAETKTYKIKKEGKMSLTGVLPKHGNSATLL